MVANIVKSAARVLEILECFEEKRRPLTITEISTSLKIPQSSTSALMKSLVRLGYVSYEGENRTFVPTLRVARLGHWTQHTLIEPEKLFDLLEELHQRTGETVVLGDRNGIHVQYVHVIQSTQDIRFYMKPGAERPICLTAVGQLLLSCMPDDEIGRLVRRINAEQQERQNPVSIDDLMSTINEIRKNGFALTMNKATPGGGVIAVLLPIDCAEKQLAVGFAAPVDRLTSRKDYFLNELREGVERYFKRSPPAPSPEAGSVATSA